MPFSRPTLADLVERTRNDFRGRLGITGALLRRAMADVLAAVWAGAVHMLHGYLEWVGRQLFGDTAEREYLLRMAAMRGITPTAATYASGTVPFTGTNATPIPMGTVLVRDDGITYRTTAAGTIAAGTATVAVKCNTAGDTGNMGVGDTLQLQSPIVGIDSTVTLTAAITGGFDEEDTEGTRDRYLLHLREPPTGGSDSDYEGWALAQPGVTRAWVYPHENGLGTVVVRFVMDDPITGVVGIPSAADVAAMQAALDAERPTTADVTAAAPTVLAVPFTIAVTPDTTVVRDAVTAELTDLFFREAVPGDGAGRGTILLSEIRTAIGTAAGVTDYTLTDPSANVVPAVGEMPTLGAFTWS